MEETRIRNCPSCGAAMECKLQNFSIGADGGGGLLTLLADQYEVDLYACPACGKVELYTAAFPRSRSLHPTGVSTVRRNGRIGSARSADRWGC